MDFKIIFTLSVMGLILGISTNLFLSYETEQPEFFNSPDIILISENSASCNNMFDGTDHNCNETSANCGEDVGGTGYNLSCTIKCDSGSKIQCGESEDPGVDSKVAQNDIRPCISVS